MMTLMQACQIVDEAREEAIIVTTMGAMGATDQLAPQRPLTVACVPLMGGAASLGMGLALARPDRTVMVLDGDASLLMELGGLVSVAQAQPDNFFHIVINNGVQFAGLGNLQTPGHSGIDFTGLARAAGYRACYRFDSAEQFAAGITEVLSGPAPAFVELAVSHNDATLGPANPAVEMTDARFTRMGDELRDIRARLGAGRA
ncbi:thiamine pyrophosphate-dependent enzyme [Alloalcanivorax mobilis]|uniref:thiamine pyrophosphate-dependent enzyme n=1 Tax=Alloalcanivorax mobilis TaxID=2019569 RepID=UPI000C77D548|nr:thiamine pyrophosphate-dependent enzyme [Alloalcanivorax mobilis]